MEGSLLTSDVPAQAPAATTPAPNAGDAPPNQAGGVAGTQNPASPNTPAAVPPVAADPAAPAATQSWRDGLSDGLKGDASLQTFDSVETMAQSYVQLRKKIGPETVIRPGPHATREEKNKFLTDSLGFPEKAEDYGVKFDKDSGIDEPFFNQFVETAHKLGIFPDQTKDLLSWYKQATDGMINSSNADVQESRRKEHVALQTKYGMALGAKQAIAGEAIEQVMGEQSESFNKEMKEKG